MTGQGYEVESSWILTQDDITEWQGISAYFTGCSLLLSSAVTRIREMRFLIAKGKTEMKVRSQTHPKPHEKSQKRFGIFVLFRVISWIVRPETRGATCGFTGEKALLDTHFCETYSCSFAV